MKVRIPQSIVTAGHADFDILDAIRAELEERAGGVGMLRELIPPLYRKEIDSVLKTAKTGRRSYAQLEKVERTYIGTLVEMMLRAELDLPRSKQLDTFLAGHPVDIKHTMGSSWMIPTEAFGYPCILSAADEKTAKCWLGLVVARPEYLRLGENKDKKTGLRADAWGNILWIYQGIRYPHNFWRNLDDETIENIFAGESGNERMRRLFRATLGVPVTREAVESVAKQKDFMRRVRADGGRGTRDILRSEGIFVLSKEFDRDLMTSLGLPVGDFVAFKPQTPAESNALRIAGRLG